MSSWSSRARRSGGRQFAVGGGRWRHVAVVDAGCGCRPRRPRQLLMTLPSFLRPSPKQSVPRSNSSSRSSSFFPSSASTASSSAATFSSYSSSSNYYSSSHIYTQKPAAHEMAKAPAPVARKKVKKRREKMEMAAEAEEEEEDVGVAVEKESSDPRADFRESMVQMVVEMGLRDWDGLRCMLRRLLALNAPRYHAAILAAFAEVCAQLTSAAAPPPPPPTPPYHYDDYYY